MKIYYKRFLNVSSKVICLLILSLVLTGCATYYIPIKSFKQQFNGIDSASLKIVDAIGPIGNSFSYSANTIDTIYCVDDNNNPVKLLNSPSIEIRFTDKNDDRTIFYFDTVYLQDSLIIGSESRFLPWVWDAIPIDSVKLIEVQDGKKNFKYSKND